jgi:4-carboxymuconolactone decarboxylase
LVLIGYIGLIGYTEIAYISMKHSIDQRKEGRMKDLHKIYTVFKKDFPEINEAHEALGEKIHKESGPLPEKVRWLIKIAISGASRHHTALETHIKKAREAGATEAEIKHALLLLIQTVGFPTFMEAYLIFKNLK